MATPSELRSWAAENRRWAGQTNNTQTAAELRTMADELDMLANAKQALDPSELDDTDAG
jgi:hypothetical protein